MAFEMRERAARCIFGRFCVTRGIASHGIAKGINATARIILLGLAVDLIYQIVVFRMFYPGEELLIALLLAFVP